jgi:hypothetical protein
MIVRHSYKLVNGWIIHPLNLYPAYSIKWVLIPKLECLELSAVYYKSGLVTTEDSVINLFTILENLTRSFIMEVYEYGSNTPLDKPDTGVIYTKLLFGIPPLRGIYNILISCIPVTGDSGF